jgi:hypothetical protein
MDTQSRALGYTLMDPKMPNQQTLLRPRTLLKISLHLSGMHYPLSLPMDEESGMHVRLRQPPSSECTGPGGRGVGGKPKGGRVETAHPQDIILGFWFCYIMWSTNSGKTTSSSSLGSLHGSPHPGLHGAHPRVEIYSFTRSTYALEGPAFPCPCRQNGAPGVPLNMQTPAWLESGLTFLHPFLFSPPHVGHILSRVPALRFPPPLCSSHIVFRLIYVHEPKGCAVFDGPWPPLS